MHKWLNDFVAMTPDDDEPINESATFTPAILQQEQISRHSKAGMWQVEILAAGNKMAKQDQTQQMEEMNLKHTVTEHQTVITKLLLDRKKDTTI